VIDFGGSDHLVGHAAPDLIVFKEFNDRGFGSDKVCHQRAQLLAIGFGFHRSADGLTALLCFGGKLAEIIADRGRRKLRPRGAVGCGQGAESHGQTGGPIKGRTMRQRARAFHKTALSPTPSLWPATHSRRQLVTLPEIPASLKARQIRR
jgi:hypothetical protein